MEPIYVQEFDITDNTVDCFGRLKPSMLLFYVQEVSGIHASTLGAGYDALMAKNLFWAILRTRVQITRLPMSGETIRVETWPMPTTRSAFPRAAAGYDEAGNLIFRCISLWVLMNTQTRQMVLPGKSGIDLEGILRGDELPTPGSLTPCDGEAVATRQVWFSELDRNGHMNNTRYLDWAMDLLPGALRRQQPLREASLCYLSEIREGDQIQLSLVSSETGIHRVDAHRLQTDVCDKKERVFSAQLVF